MSTIDNMCPKFSIINVINTVSTKVTCDVNIDNTKAITAIISIAGLRILSNIFHFDSKFSSDLKLNNHFII
ncbi:hypothetical protein D3C71_1978640 [compost metagenome]